MIVHFIASEFNITDTIEDLRSIVRILHKQEYSLARDWIEPAYARRLRAEEFKTTDWNSVYKESLEAIARADVVIAEVTHESSSIGYQVAFAVQHKKPILLIRKSDAAKDVFVNGLKDSYVIHKEYKETTELDSIIGTFLQDNRIENKDMRFNFFIDRGIYNYLRWAALKTGKTKAEILRELVQHEIEKQDFKP
jgi:nucleoside 2-deoxyribosyltransferase